MPGKDGVRAPEAQSAGKPGRRPRKQDAGQVLSRERIAVTAVEVLNADGLGGLTMRRLADRLGSGVMSLYWHVDNKEDVFDLALDSVLAYDGPPDISEPGNWRLTIVDQLEDWRQCLLRHPWSAVLLPQRPLGPNMLGRLERLGRALSLAGVADDRLNVAIWSIWNFVMGAAITRAGFELSDEEMAAGQQRLSGAGELYPTLTRTRLLLDGDWDGTFRQGIDHLLTGLVPTTGPAGSTAARGAVTPPA